MAEPKSRKGIGLNTFRHSGLSIDTRGEEAVEGSPPASVLRKHKRELSFVSPPINTGPSSPASPKIVRVSSGLSLARSHSPKSRPKGVRRSTRTSSIFGSIRSFQSLQDDHKDYLTRSDSNHSSIYEDDAPLPFTLTNLAEMNALQHGEVAVSATGVTGRSKKTVYLVLTDTALLRFKSHQDAANCLSIPTPKSRSRSRRHSRTNSVGSINALMPPIDGQFPLANIIGVYRLDDGLPFFSWEAAYWDEHYPSSRQTISFHPEDADERDLWITSIRRAVLNVPHLDAGPFGDATIMSITKILDRAHDYDPNQFRLFRVAKRALKDGNRDSTVELNKLTTSVGYLAIGIHKVHLLMPRVYPKVNDSSGLADFVGSSHHLLNLNAISLQPSDDLFQLTFRQPFERPTTLHLMSTYAADIALTIRQSTEYLKPEWQIPSFMWTVPSKVHNNLLQPLHLEYEDDEKDFNRTLVAHCLAYGVEASNIRFCVNQSSNGPTEFELLPPADIEKPRYAPLELLAILRSLRYNDSFQAINFHHVSLDVLRNLQDHFDNLPAYVTFGEDVRVLPSSSKSPYLLVQELQALALKNKKLRKLDFTACLNLPKKSTMSENNDDYEGSVIFRKRAANRIPDDGSRICEALFPLCKGYSTDVDWIVLSEIQLGEADVEYMYTGLQERAMHLRGLELHRCGLTDYDRKVILAGLRGQKDTLEVLELTENMGRSQPALLNRNIADFSRLRVLNLSKFSVLPSEDPLLSLEVLKQWRLEELILSHIPISQATVDALVQYIQLEQSSTLRRLSLDGCSLDGGQIAAVLEGLSSGYPKGRTMHLDISHDKLEEHHDAFVFALSTIPTPTQMTMHSIEYRDQDSFRHLLSALAVCKTLVTLDMSQIFLHTESDAATGRALFDMLADNESIRELNMSGSHSTLEVDTLGYELCNALKGLQYNHTLRVLVLHLQKLAQPGIGALAQVLRHNDTLQELHCDNNGVTLQCFSGLVHALEDNHTLLYLSDLGLDRAAHERQIEREYQSSISSTSKASTSKASTSKASTSKASTPSPTTSRFSVPSWMQAKHKKGNGPPGASKTAAAAAASSPSRTSQSVPSTPSTSLTRTSSRLSRAPKKKPSLPQMFSLKRTMSRRSSLSPVIGMGEYEAGMEVFHSVWDREIVRCNYYLRRNWCTTMGVPVDVADPMPRPATGGGAGSAQSAPPHVPPVGRSPLWEGIGIADGGEGEEEAAVDAEGGGGEEVVSPLLGEEEETPRGELERRLELLDVEGESEDEEGGLTMEDFRHGDEGDDAEDAGENVTPRGSVGSFTGDEKENLREVLRAFGGEEEAE